MERLNKRQLDDFSDDVIEKVIPKKRFKYQCVYV